MELGSQLTHVDRNQVHRVTVMLVTSLCWWLNDGDHFKMFVTKKYVGDIPIGHLHHTGGIMTCPEKHVKDIFFTWLGLINDGDHFKMLMIKKYDGDIFLHVGDILIGHQHHILAYHDMLCWRN